MTWIEWPIFSTFSSPPHYMNECPLFFRFVHQLIGRKSYLQHVTTTVYQSCWFSPVQAPPSAVLIYFNLILLERYQIFKLVVRTSLMRICIFCEICIYVLPVKSSLNYLHVDLPKKNYFTHFKLSLIIIIDSYANIPKFL